MILANCRAHHSPHKKTSPGNKHSTENPLGWPHPTWSLTCRTSNPIITNLRPELQPPQRSLCLPTLAFAGHCLADYPPDELNL